MEAHEKPHWLNETCWPSKYAMIMTDMLNTTAVASGSKAGLVSNTIKKKGRRKNSDIALELLQHSQYAVDGGEESGSESDNQSTMSDKHIVAGKVMRKRKDVQYDDHLTDLQYTRILEKQADEASNTNKPIATGTTIYKELVTVINTIQKYKREDGSQLAFIFIDKPPKSIYPDYYQLISEPIALKQIQNKLRKTEYNYFEEIEVDFALMCHNARVYNLDTSPVYADCELIRTHFYTLALPLLRKYNVADAVNTSPLPLPPTNHYIYPTEYVYRKLLPHTEMSADVESSAGATAASAKKIPKNKKRMLEGDYDAVSTPNPGVKKKAKLSATPSNNSMAYDYADNHGNLSLSLKKNANGSTSAMYASSNSLYDGNANEESLYLSIPLKRKRE